MRDPFKHLGEHDGGALHHHQQHHDLAGIFIIPFYYRIFPYSPNLTLGFCFISYFIHILLLIHINMKSIPHAITLTLIACAYYQFNS